MIATVEQQKVVLNRLPRANYEIVRLDDGTVCYCRYPTGAKLREAQRLLVAELPQ